MCQFEKEYARKFRNAIMKNRDKLENFTGEYLGISVDVSTKEYLKNPSFDSEG